MVPRRSGVNDAATTPRERIEEDWAVRLPLACTPQGYLAQVMGSSRWSGLERLPSLRVLVVHGEDDRLVPPANGRRIAQPERTDDLLLGWLARRRDQPGA